MLEDEREDREEANKEVDGHERERDADDRMLEYLVELWSISRPNRPDRNSDSDSDRQTCTDAGERGKGLTNFKHHFLAKPCTTYST